MNRDRLVERLNADLALEYKSIVQTILHVATLEGARYRSTLQELGNHLNQEVEHALTLARQIHFLGGTPTAEVAPVDATDGTRDALEHDLALERRQLARYRERTREATEAGFPDVAEVLAPILSETQDHVRELEQALGDPAPVTV